MFHGFKYLDNTSNKREYNEHLEVASERECENPSTCIAESVVAAHGEHYLLENYFFIMIFKIKIFTRSEFRTGLLVSDSRSLNHYTGTPSLTF